MFITMQANLSEAWILTVNIVAKSPAFQADLQCSSKSGKFSSILECVKALFTYLLKLNNEEYIEGCRSPPELISVKNL